MQSGNNIHVQQHKTHMINEEWNKTQNDAAFVAFYDVRAVTFVLPDEMADVSIAGMPRFFFIPRLNHTGSHGPIDSHAIPYLHREKNIGFGTRTTQPAAILRITGKAAAFRLWFGRLLLHAIEKDSKCAKKKSLRIHCRKEENTGNQRFLLSCPARVAQWWACRTHDLVVVSSRPGWGEISFRRIFASHLCWSMWEK